MKNKVIKNTKNLCGVVIALQFPFCWESVKLPANWNVEALADQRIQETGFVKACETTGFQDSNFVTIEWSDEHTIDEMIEAIEAVWFSTPTNHPVNFCHDCAKFTQWELVTFSKKCKECGEWEGGESEKYLLEFEPLEYWTQTFATEILEWETFGPQSEA